MPIVPFAGGTPPESPSEDMSMTEPQEMHLTRVISRFSSLCDAKYRKGQKEHGGDLFELPVHALLDAAIDEAVDQVVYLLTLKERLL